MSLARIAFGTMTVLIAASFGAPSANAQYPGWPQPFTERSHPDVFYNLYVDGPGATPAAAYPAPVPTPAVVGHTYVTYQPFMPAEFLYHHHRTYQQFYDSGRGMNRTRVSWYSPPVRTGIQNAVHHFKLAR